jgi:photosystem II stability/assembly factor-like uncharacterized protein
MRLPYRRSIWLSAAVLLAALGLAALLTLASRASAGASDPGQARVSIDHPWQAPGEAALEASAIVTPSLTISRYLPVLLSYGYPAVELKKAWINNGQGSEKLAFLSGEDLVYQADFRNNLSTPVSTSLVMTQTGPCGGSTIFSGTLTLPPGDYAHKVASSAQVCTGIYTTEAGFSYQVLSNTLRARHIVITGVQGFDRCTLPTVNRMQTWWDSSPYSVYNLYLGGISFPTFCQPASAQWVHQVADQGWSFILAWVGPQAPCTSYEYRMSSDRDAAKKEGRDEAGSAFDAAQQLGFGANLMIYYDMEAYGPATSPCRNTVSAFMRGWTERLHELGAKAGGYGAGCSSYVTDWAGSNPPPDDIWIAHWYRKTYYPGAIVWDTPCVSNELWSQQQRVKQYAGGHSESWGGVSMNIDSNAFEKRVVDLPAPLVEAAGAVKYARLETHGPPVSDFGLLGPSQGWARVGERLLRTQDGGASWQDLTPADFSVLGAGFSSPRQGWLVGWHAPGAGLQVGRSLDGGLSWDFTPLTLSGWEGDLPVAAYLSWLDERRLWIALKLPSGSSFSRGRLFATQDGGETWQERSLPLGERVTFIDDLRGWTAGGSAGSQLYFTRDGGLSWQPGQLALPDGEQGTIGLPYFSAGQDGRLPVLLSGPAGERLVVYTSPDAGQTWRLEGGEQVNAAQEVDALIRTSSASPAGYWSAFDNNIPPAADLVDFLDDRQGWVLVQEGACQAEEGSLLASISGAELLRCERRWRLLATEDGGSTWREISPGG